ncbi:hypothetical protein HPP92_013504 [Vanilla planifolia]|uniref:Uncharacterized protein n=1 Tax=Vanilla planifolia TaxID=51239 RepID=A0A835QZ65_VANPL|nr:hypothetical protein HPP92_013504 [Vanilla planifolia]
MQELLWMKLSCNLATGWHEQGEAISNWSGVGEPVRILYLVISEIMTAAQVIVHQWTGPPLYLKEREGVYNEVKLLSVVRCRQNTDE